jgi:sn-glycerol 3-phosphate transport system substrate-binding protein
MGILLKTLSMAIALMMASLAPASEVEISFYYPVSVGGQVSKVIDAMAADFEKENPGIKVRPIYSGTYKESIVKALTAHKSGAPPAMAVLFAVDMYTLIAADAIVPFDEFAVTADDKAWLGGFYPAFMTNSRAAGKTWGIPFQRSTILLYWNKEMFRQAGLDPDHAPANWGEMAAYAQKLTRRDASGNVEQWGIQIPSSGFPYWLFQGLATPNGAELMNAAGTETRFDNAAAIEALQYWVDLARVLKVHPPGVVEWGATPNDFFNKKVAMIWTTSGNLSNVKNNARFDFGAAMLPASRRRGSPTGGGNFYVFRKSTPQQQQAAFKFIRWATSPARAAQWAIDTGYIAVRDDAWNTPAMKRHVVNFPLAAVAHEQLQYSSAEFSTYENQRVTKALNNGLVTALSGIKTPAQAMQDAQAEAVRILRPYQR